MNQFSPAIPLELEREIFETAAYSSPEVIRNLVLVAHRAYEWIDRIRYQTVSSHGSACPFRFLQQAIRSNSKTDDFFHDRVRNLFVDFMKDGIQRNDLPDVLSMCTGVRSLVLLGVTVEPLMSTYLRNLKLQRLSFFLIPGLVWIDPLYPVFASLTHLDLFDDLSNGSVDFPSLLADLALLPALTHLALFNVDPAELEPEDIPALKKIEVLVIMELSKPHYLSMYSFDDPRIVVMWLNNEEYAEDWLNGTRGDPDFWARAELFIGMRRREEIYPNSRCWIEPGDGV
ncbi:hypothetical protein B0H15DRAFT_463526 [Mycena belliarum]|uniref:Uncharacterized protein n=1 Tax=Mycena belliarum TaxID=1033014 RepID=A0AAD6TJZ7_9AGAR|nr:hypothetical protein B0H15DRAFT_264321 [Mycena belliae]KAJ7100882.1 hypothetical protein B0H15DRAFT_463526 [Mycena belliae]